MKIPESHGLLPCGLSAWGTLTVSQNDKGYFYCCCILAQTRCHNFAEGNAALVAGCEEIKLTVNVKPPVCWLPFITPEGAMQATRGELLSRSLLSCIPSWYSANMPDKRYSALRMQKLVSNCVLRPTPSTGRNSCLVLCVRTKKLLAGEDTSLSGKQLVSSAQWM